MPDSARAMMQVTPQSSNESSQAMKCFHAAQLDKSGDTMKPKLNGARPKATMEPGRLEKRRS